MNKKIVLSLVIPFIIFFSAGAQSNVMNKGFNDLVIGISRSQLDDIVGFQGMELNPDEYFEKEGSGRKKEELPEFKKGFDKCIEYKFLMPIPVTRVFLKNNIVVMIEVSSFPDFTRPICLDSKTNEGLKFWDKQEVMEKIYGKGYRTGKSKDGNTTYFYYDSRGIGFTLTNNEIRIIYFY